MHSKPEENCSSRILICLVSAVVFWIISYVSGNAGGTWQPQTHRCSWNNPRRLERSAIVFIDHICHVILKRKSAPWGSFRTPHRERIMADIVIISMLYESTAIVSVNGLLYVYQFIYLQNIPLLKLLQEFVIYTSVPLAIEWFFTGVTLAIETRFQNIAVMAVWRKRWKRHILVAITNLVPLAFWTTANLLEFEDGRFDESQSYPCKMPFT